MTSFSEEIILYQFPGPGKLPSLSPPCVKIQLALKNLKLEHRVKNLNSSMEVKKVSPSGRVPALAYRGEVLVDSVSIMDRLEKDHSQAPLFSGDKTQNRLWEIFSNDHLYWLGFYFRWCHPQYRDRFFKVTFGKMPWLKQQLVKWVFLPDIRKRGLAHGIGRQKPELIEKSMMGAFQTLSEGLAEKPFLNGDHPGRGDLGVAATLVQVGYQGTMENMDQHIKEKYPELLDLTARVFKACDMTPPPWLIKQS